MPLQVKFMGSYQSPYFLKSLATLSHASDMIGAIADKIGGLEDSEKRFR
ncbi:putative phage tail fiber assembly protein [Yersinia enterocolitica]|nr:putative phage tail fiber assembly protein [Yersinia enterocolitica]